MKETGPDGDQQSRQDPGSGRGIFFRVFVATVAPVLLLVASGVLIDRSLYPDGAPIFTGEDFLSYFVAAGALAILLSLILTFWIDVSLRGQLRMMIRSIRSGRRTELQDLEMGEGWGGISTLAEELQTILEKSEKGSQDSVTLGEMREATEVLSEKIRVWEETEALPEVQEGGVLAAVSDRFRKLAIRIADRDREAIRSTDLTLESLTQARSRIEKVAKEVQHASLEVAGMRKDLTEIRALTESLLPRVREDLEKVKQSDLNPARLLKLVQGELEISRRESGELLHRMEEFERSALRAALQHSSARLLLARWLGQRGEGAPADEDLPLIEVGELRLLAQQAQKESVNVRELRDRLSTLLAELEAASTEGEPSGETTAVDERLELTGAIEYALAEIQSKGERLAALTERAQRQTENAITVTEAAVADLQGLARRFAPIQNPPATASDNAPQPGAEAANPSPPAEMDPAWSSAATPLRLLTRDDVLPDEDVATSPAPEKSEDGAGDG